MNTAPFKFVIIEAPDGTPQRGPAVFKDGKRIGQLIVELVDELGVFNGHAGTGPDHLVAEMRVELKA